MPLSAETPAPVMTRMLPAGILLHSPFPLLLTRRTPASHPNTFYFKHGILIALRPPWGIFLSMNKRRVILAFLIFTSLQTFAGTFQTASTLIPVPAQAIGTASG